MRWGYALVRLLSQAAFRLLFGIAVRGMENIPRTGKLIIASNHRSNFDPPLLGGTIPRETHFFAKAELFRGKLLGRFIRYLNAFPVKRGQFDRQSLTHCLDVLNAGDALLFFPEGTRAPENGFLRSKLGLGWVVSLSDAPVVPVYIHGSTVTKPRFWNRPAISIIVGQPWRPQQENPQALRGKDLYQQISDRVLERIRQLSLTTPDGRVSHIGLLYERGSIEDERLR